MDEKAIKIETRNKRRMLIMKKKYGIPLLLISSITASTIAGISQPASMSYAQTNLIGTEATSTSEDAQQMLTNVTKKVKSKITIPSQYTQFEYSKYDNVDGEIWFLNWEDKEQSKRIQVKADNMGRILTYSHRNYEEENYTPKYKKDALKQKADAFIKKVASDISGKLQYKGNESVGPYAGYYLYVYERVENGIVVPDNTIRVGVNYETGEVVQYESEWAYDLKIPEKNTKVSKTQAIEKIKKEVKMELVYKTYYDENQEDSKARKAFLAYVPNKSYLSVDAKSGTIYTEKVTYSNSYEEKRNENASAGETAADTGKQESSLTQEEINQIKELNGLISKEEAIKIIKNNKKLLIDSKMTKVSANLQKREQQDGTKSYIWNLTLQDPREISVAKDDMFRGYATANIDAKTGKILSFYSSVKDYNVNTTETTKVNYKKEEAQKIFETFAKEQVPNYMKQSEFSNAKEDYILLQNDKETIYGGYYYQYNRVYKDIPYEDNKVYGNVDGVTGKIYRFSYDWNDSITFEQPNKIITPEQAFDAYIEKDGFDLIYEINTIYDLDKNNNSVKKEDVRFVYAVNITPEYISPFDGKQLTYYGNTYNGKEDTYKYKDISDHKSAENIELLADIGIGFAEENFQPEKAITKAELYQFLNKINYGYKATKDLKNNNNTITRLDTAKLIVELLDLEKVAKLTGIYQLDFADKDTISSTDTGYIALVEGFGLLSVDGKNNFRPKENLTRAEAADFMVGIMGLR